MHDKKALLVVLVLTAALYIPSLFGDFLAFDDELLILDNSTVHGLNVSNVAEAFTTYDPELYIPITLLSYQIEWMLVAATPLLYHVTNIVIHLASVAFVFLILQRFFSLHVSILCALLFALHPLQVETVAWISGRKDLLSSLFFLASTHMYLRWMSDGTGKRMSVLLFVCGLLSKVSIFPLPFCLLLLDRLGGKKISKESLKNKLPYFILAAIFVVIALVGKSTQASDPYAAIILAPASLMLTITHIVYPVGLTIFYPYIEIVSLLNPQVLFGVVTLVVLGSVGVITSKKSPYSLFALLWMLILIAPSLLNMQKGGELGIPDIYLTSDRYAYLALLGPIFLIGHLLSKYSRAIGIIPVVIFATITFIQIGYWNNSVALFQRAIDVDQPSHVAYTNIAGYTAQDGDFKTSEQLFEKALEIRRSSRILFNLAQIKAHLGKTEEAITLYKELLTLTPNDDEARKKMNSLL